MGPPHTICASSALFPTPSISWGLFSIPSFHFIIVEQKNGPGSDLVKKFLQKMSAENGLSTWIRNVSDKNIVVSYQCMWILFFLTNPKEKKKEIFFIDIEAKMLSL